MQEDGISVLSLFDGISCGQLALQRLGVKVKNYFASEIDEYAIKVTQYNFPNTIQIGNVNDVKANNLPKIDLLIGGSPCQGFSFVGKQLGFDDSRSKLFFEYVRLLKECKPKYFLMENVRMKKEHENIISQYLGRKPIVINSALLSAQNRVRLYWTNIANEKYGLFGENKCVIKQPNDKGILLNDILEHDVSREYYINNAKFLTFIQDEKRMKKKYVQIGGKKALTQTTRQYKNWNGTYIREGNNKIRRLTPVECERLQTIPDNYTACVSDSQRYRLLGNAWTVDVIAYIISHATF